MQASEFFPWLITSCLIGGVIIGSINSIKRGMAARTKFTDLGVIKGKERKEFIDALGPPTSVSILGGDLTLLQWKTKDYNVVLRFNGEICEGVSTDLTH